MRMRIFAIICIHLLLWVRCESTPSSRKLGHEQMGEHGSFRRMAETEVINNGIWRKLLEENVGKHEETKVDETEKVEVSGDVKESVVAGAQAEEMKIEPIVEKGEVGAEIGSKEEPRKDMEVGEEAKVDALGKVSIGGTEKMETTQKADITVRNAQGQEVLHEETTSGTSEPQKEASKEGTIEEEKPAQSTQAQRENDKPVESLQAQKEEGKSIEVQKDEKILESAEIKVILESAEIKVEEKPVESEGVPMVEEKTSDKRGELQKEEVKPDESNVEVHKEEEPFIEHLAVQEDKEKPEENTGVQKEEETLIERKEDESPVEESSVEKADAEQKRDVSGLEQKPEDIKEEATAVAGEENRQNTQEEIKASSSEGGGEKQEELVEDGHVSAAGIRGEKQDEPAGTGAEKQDESQEDNPIKMVESRGSAGEEKEADKGMVEQKSEPEEQTTQELGADVESQVKLDEETQAATKEVESQLELLKRDTVLDPIDDHRQEPSDDDYDIIQELVDLPTKLHETAGKVADHIRPDVQKWTDTSKVYFNLANQQITESFSPLIGKKYAPFFASMTSYGILLLPLIVVIVLFDRIKALFSLQKVLLFVNIYLAAYFATLWLASFIIGLEPMSFFYKNNLSSYLSLQLLQALGYVIYLILQTTNFIYACSSDTFAGKVTAILQWVVSMAIGLHYYVTVFHPAVASKPPHMSWKFYAVYSVAFFVLCLCARIRWVKKQYFAGDSVTNKKS